MKRKSIISLFVILMGFGVSTTSCEDMLTPDMDRYAENFTGRDTVNFYFGILRNLQDGGFGLVGGLPICDDVCLLLYARSCEIAPICTLCAGR